VDFSRQRKGLHPPSRDPKQILADFARALLAEIESILARARSGAGP
jgi:hypothetical protein